MSEKNGAASPKLLSVKEAAERLGLSISYLNKMRVHGGTLPFVKIGASVRYRPEDLEVWVAGHVRRSTSDTTGQAVGVR